MIDEFLEKLTNVPFKINDLIHVENVYLWKFLMLYKL